MNISTTVTLSAPLYLNPIQLKKVKDGGYKISCSGKIPLQSRLRLVIQNDPVGVELNTASHGDLVGAAQLPALLASIGRQKLWGQEVACHLVAFQGAQAVAASNQVKIKCPVRPYAGRLCPEMGRLDAGPKMNYTGIQNGRMLAQPAVDGCYYFVYGGQFETNNTMRGLNCITFAGAVFGVDPASRAMSGYGTQLADFLRATPCGLEGKTAVEIKKHFATRSVETYLMWNMHHVVVISRAMIHEFSLSHHGYRVTPIADWHFAHAPFWVRRTLKQF